MPLFIRSEHTSKHGKAECGINWCPKGESCFAYKDYDYDQFIQPALNQSRKVTIYNLTEYRLYVRVIEVNLVDVISVLHLSTFRR